MPVDEEGTNVTVGIVARINLLMNTLLWLYNSSMSVATTL